MFATTPFVFKADQQTSVTPAWRNSLWHVSPTRSDALILLTHATISSQVVVSEIWNFNTTVTEKRSIIDKLSASADILRNITPNSGAYMVRNRLPLGTFLVSKTDHKLGLERG